METGQRVGWAGWRKAWKQHTTRTWHWLFPKGSGDRGKPPQSLQAQEMC